MSPLRKNSAKTEGKTEGTQEKYCLNETRYLSFTARSPALSPDALLWLLDAWHGGGGGGSFEREIYSLMASIEELLGTLKNDVRPQALSFSS